jgi:hypothetical protein
MMGKALTIVREGLKAYADRGVFRSYAEQSAKDGKVEFRFLFIGQKTVTVVFTEKDHTLVIKNMLSSVLPDMYVQLKDFLAGLHDPDLPEHRRIDRALAEVKFVRRGGNVSLVFRVQKNYKYGVSKLINLISWIHTYLQNWCPDYLWEVLGEPQE